MKVNSFSISSFIDGHNGYPNTITISNDDGTWSQSFYYGNYISGRNKTETKVFIFDKIIETSKFNIEISANSQKYLKIVELKVSYGFESVG